MEKKAKKEKPIETVGDLIRVLRKLPKDKKLRMNVVVNYDDIEGFDYDWRSVDVFDATDGVVIMERPTDGKDKD